MSVAHLRGGGVSFVVAIEHPLPRIVHWGADLGDLDADALASLAATSLPAVLNNSPDGPRTLTVWPGEREAWAGFPAQSGHAHSRSTTPRPELTTWRIEDNTLDLTLEDGVTEVRVELRYALDAAGVVSAAARLTRLPTASAPYALGHAALLLPLPERATEIVDFTGTWIGERRMQRLPVVDGRHTRETRRGKPGHDSPYLTIVGTPGVGFRHGEAWAGHLAWSGDSQMIVERRPEGAGGNAAVLGLGERLGPGEIVLEAGDAYTTPTALLAWSDRGLDGIADRFHRRLRARPTHPRAPRPIVVNSWEAVYFDHDRARLDALVDAAAEVGAERFVLDDGWFRGRRGPTAGLGDWTVDADVWPDGLGGFASRVRDRGMSFGIWVEPEMVNLDSDAAREHPEWILGPSPLGPSARHQYVLNLAHPDAFAHVLRHLDDLLGSAPIAFVKWDHNRDLLEPVGRGGDDGRWSVHAQTLALYSLLDELRRRHPAVEFESCSAGGGRIDLGILERTERVWASDCNDPVDRAAIERGTALLVPPELIGSHVGPPRAHTTGRASDLSTRLTVAFFGHAGIEWDLTTVSDAERRTIAQWTALHRDARSVLHTGEVVNADLADPATSLRGVVAADGARAFFAWSRSASSPPGLSARTRFPGLDPASRYRVRLHEWGEQPVRRTQVRDPEWLAGASDRAVPVSGAALAVAGVALPSLSPEQTLLIEITRA